MDGVKWKSSCLNLDDKIAALQRECALPRPVAMYFAARDIRADQVNAFLNPKLADISDPYRIPGIRDAVARLWQAVFNKEPILVHGDYDTDGITACALLSFVLRHNGAEVHSFIPHRFDDGYGFTPESLDKALAASGDCKVLVTVDCGVTSVDAVKRAVEKNIDVIITDHHEPGTEVPPALAVISFKLYPELHELEMLSGAGVAFKLAHAFVKYGRDNNYCRFATPLNEVLDLVALGTVADIVPLLGENRIMVKHGIEVLRRQMRPGVRALIESSKLRNELAPSDITFKLAPRINAAGRVGDAGVALQLLESDNIVEAYQFASQLEDYNAARQQKEQEIYQEARDLIERTIDYRNCNCILVAGHEWHQGVIGIVASRLARDYNRPAIVLTIQDNLAYGSGRSVGSLNLVDVLSRAGHLLERFGGHPMAVGVGLKVEHIPAFRELLEREIGTQVQPGDFDEFLPYDGTVALGELSAEFFDYLVRLAPFGHGNPRPVYRLEDVTVARAYPIGVRHVRGELRDCQGYSMDFIAFNQVDQIRSGDMLDLLVSPQINERYGNAQMQLNVIASMRT